MKLSHTIFLTGGAVSRASVELKEMMFPDFRFERRDTSSLLGAAMLGKHYLCKYKEH